MVILFFSLVELDLDNIFITIFSLLVISRFIVKLIKNDNFKNDWDLSISIVLIFVFILRILNNSNISKWLDKIICMNSESHLFQVMFVHFFLLSIIFSMTVGILLIFMIFRFFLFPYKADFMECRSKFINAINKCNKKFVEWFKFDLCQFLNDYINPFYNIKFKNLSQNTRLMRKILLMLYVVTGIIIIFYWKEAVSIIEIISKSKLDVLLQLPINETDLNNYKLVFVMPLLGMLLSKPSKTKDN